MKSEGAKANTLEMMRMASTGCVHFKGLSSNGLTLSALLNTGSDLCLMRYDVLMMLGKIDLSNDII